MIETESLQKEVARFIRELQSGGHAAVRLSEELAKISSELELSVANRLSLQSNTKELELERHLIREQVAAAKKARDETENDLQSIREEIRQNNESSKVSEEFVNSKTQQVGAE